MFRFILSCLFAALIARGSVHAAASAAPSSVRERANFDADWRFAFGHPSDPAKDFNHGTGYFSYFAKAGNGDGPADPKFDASAWRRLDLPHDWAVEAPFDGKGSHSHGYKAIGRNFPERSVGWYRKTFEISADDLGRRIALEFDGVHRDSLVWVNGFFLGRQHSGSTSFRYDITDYLNYGGTNTVAVRVDVTMEEGWYYEGAGIYRHVWLTKTAPLHVAQWGTFVTTDVSDDFSHAEVTARATIANDGTAAATFQLEQTVLSPDGGNIATKTLSTLSVAPGEMAEFSVALPVAQPRLWSVETPTLHRLVTVVRDAAGNVVDRYETPFGIRTMRWDPNAGFFLNGKHVLLKGTNNHQDHAGVGVAVPDALWDFRIRRLKEFGSNAYRTSHHPPAPELLEACDRLGLLVLDENRLMGASPEQLGALEAMIRRDRNHPSVIIWSAGNEEWAIEGNEKGARLSTTMQALARRLDPTRRTTVAISGGWGGGSSSTADVMGYNYFTHGSTDDQHAKFPQQPGVGTEETTDQGTRGIYFDDKARAHQIPPVKGDSGGNVEIGWQHFAARPYLAGLFYWTGFDYRGESNPFGFPAVSSQYGIMDTCGFPKDQYYFLKSWWTDEPVLHVFPHWNWPDKVGQSLKVGCYSNHEAVELFLNGVSLGKKDMPRNGHLEWQVVYQPGVLEARGYRGGKVVQTTRVETTGAPAKLVLTADRGAIRANGTDVVVIDVSTIDAQGRHVPTANQLVKFSVVGGRIIGVGNGDPSCHESDNGSERSLFNGYAQVIVQASRELGKIRLTAQTDGLASAELTVVGADENAILENETRVVSGFLLNNNVWGKPSSPTGWQLVDVAKPGEALSWNVRYNWPVGTNPHGVKCYPSIVTGWQWGVWSTDGRLPMSVSELSRLVSGASATLTNPGVQNLAYDLWFHAAAPVRSEDKPSDELMIWMGRYGGAGPLGALREKVQIDGVTWSLYVGDIGWKVFSFVREENAASWRVDVKAFIDHLVRNGLMAETKQLSSVQFGTEVFSSPGDARLDITEYFVQIEKRSK